MFGAQLTYSFILRDWNCLLIANFRFFSPSLSPFEISITDPPEIAVENPIVYSGEGQEAMLVCIVHGESQPEVSLLAL